MKLWQRSWHLAGQCSNSYCLQIVFHNWHNLSRATTGVTIHARAGGQRVRAGRTSEGQHWAPRLFSVVRTISSRAGSRDLPCIQVHTRPDKMPQKGVCSQLLFATLVTLQASRTCVVFLVHSPWFCPSHLLPVLTPWGTALYSTKVINDHYKNLCKWVSKFPSSIFSSAKITWVLFCQRALPKEVLREWKWTRVKRPSLLRHYPKYFAHLFHLIPI